jgi:hypothetical protein
MIEFRKIKEPDPALAHSPMVKAIEKTFACPNYPFRQNAADGIQTHG